MRMEDEVLGGKLHEVADNIDRVRADAERKGRQRQFLDTVVPILVQLRDTADGFKLISLREGLQSSIDAAENERATV